MVVFLLISALNLCTLMSQMCVPSVFAQSVDVHVPTPPMFDLTLCRSRTVTTFTSLPMLFHHLWPSPQVTPYTPTPDSSSPKPPIFRNYMDRKHLKNNKY